MKTVRIDLTTNGSGAATGFGNAVNGLLYAVQLIAGDFASGVDLTLTSDLGDSLSVPLLVKANFNTSQFAYPRVLEHDAADGTDLTTYTMPLIAGRPKAVIAQGGDTKTGAVVLFILEGLTDFVRVQSVDITRPTVVITSSESSPTSASPIPITVTFSEAVSGFTVGDLIVANGTAGAFAATSTSVYTAEITPTGAGAVTVDIYADSAIDTSGNGNYVATQFSITYTP
jgi:hypothetical protein